MSSHFLLLNHHVFWCAATPPWLWSRPRGCAPPPPAAAGDSQRNRTFGTDPLSGGSALVECNFVPGRKRTFTSSWNHSAAGGEKPEISQSMKNCKRACLVFGRNLLTGEDVWGKIQMYYLKATLGQFHRWFISNSSLNAEVTSLLIPLPDSFI